LLKKIQDKNAADLIQTLIRFRQGFVFAKNAFQEYFDLLRENLSEDRERKFAVC